jgi:ComF family protein
MLLFLSSAFNVVFPDDCRICEQPLRRVSRIPVCPECLALPSPLATEFFCRSCRTPYLSSYSLNEQGLCPVCCDGGGNFDAVYAFGEYEGTLRKLIHLFKYSKIESLAGPLGKLLVRALPVDTSFDLVMAMPMHWRKHWARGFNQAELLAEPVARRLGLKLSKQLSRARRTKAQAGLSEVQRRNNLKGSFRVKDVTQIRGKRILLVDDVFTTGATLRAATSFLKASGARHVSALVLARVDRRTTLTTFKPPPRQDVLDQPLAAQEV